MSSPVISTAVRWALSIADDDSHGYDQNDRWGPDYDCSSFVISAYDFAGLPVKDNGAGYTGNMVTAFKKTGFVDVTHTINLDTGEGLETGDVLWRTGHTELIYEPGKMVGATGNEIGDVVGGATGDQTTREIRRRDYYNPTKTPWEIVLRYNGVGYCQIPIWLLFKIKGV